MKAKQWSVLFLTLSGLLSPFEKSNAQSFTGTILGTLKDSSGAVVLQAIVTVTNADTNAKTEVRTDDSGSFTAPLLPPGHYNVEASAPGFKKFVRQGIVLQVQQQARVDITLELGEVTESIVVNDDATLLEATTSSVGKVVDNRRIVNLPLNTRNVYSLVFLTPGVTGTVGNNYGEMRWSVNGARSRTMDTLIDGVTASHATVTGGSGISVFPSVDAIEEFKVMGSNYTAEFGRSQGSVLNVVFKSGTNQVHGSAYEFLRNSVFDAQNFFANTRGEKLGSFKRSQFGGVLSGPIRKDKTFFMGDYEGLRERSFATSTSTVPTLLERQGDFSQTLAANGQLVRIFDPATTRANPSGSGSIRDPFLDNRIPSNRFDPVAVNVMKYYPLPNVTGDPLTRRNNYTKSGSRQVNLDQFDVRIDHAISERQKFFTRYSHRRTESVPLVAFPDDLTIAEGRVIEQDRVRGFVADHAYTINPTTILNSRLGFARTLYVYDNQGLGFLPSSLGLPKSIDTAADRAMFPRFAATNYVNLGGNDHRWNAFMSYTAQSSLTKIVGRHTFKAGYEGRLFRVNVWEARDAGNFSFSAGFTQGPNPSTASTTAGNGIASLLLGTGSSGNLIQGWKNVAAQSLYHATYFQDDWRATSKLTLNLGLRYDVELPRTERYNRMNYFDPAARSPLARPQYSDLRGGVVFVGVDGNSRSQYITDRNNFAPRFGFAYQATTKTVVRGGFGYFFGASEQTATGTVGPFGFRTENPWQTSLDNGLTPYRLLKDPFPQGFQPPPGASQGLLTSVGGRLEAPLQDTPNPYTMQWNFGIQHELPGKVLFEVAYVGNRGLQLRRNTESGLNLNQLDPQYLALGSALNQQVPNPFAGIGFFSSSTFSRGQSLRPYPQFLDVIPLMSVGASSNYHAMQVTMSKRYSHGLLFEGSYAWGKTIDDGESHQNSYNVKGDRSLTDLDIAHRFIISYVYELPFGRGRHFGQNVSGPANWLLGGWQMNGITTFQTGTPLSISASNTAGLFNPTIRANNNGTSGLKTGPVHERLDAYFDKSVFSQPAAFTFGNMSTRLPDIRNDGIKNFDLSLFKDFQATEQIRVQFRAEFLNTFNTPRFGSPETNVTNSSFGRITSQANAPRQVQFGLKLLW
ncbi:MAG TPA: TonB-dependent receptor [Terriglobia bacterium]|nr:TonB-dependent receptor [Terriglobia bacterium]